MLSKLSKNSFHQQEVYKVNPPISPNKKIGGCTLIKKLGQGGMGSVYQANQLSMDRTVALKVLSPEFTKDKEKRERFLKEAKISAKLHHPHIIAVHGAGFDNGICYYLMEYLEGGSVEDLLKKEGKLSEERTLEIAYQVTLALQHAHQNNLVHRDIKPDNFMITESGSIKVCDLGLAKMLDSGDAHLTQEGTFLGTPYFTSPEQAKGKSNIDIRADLYSLGASLYYLATGKHIFESDSPIGVISMHLNDEPKVPSEINPKLSRGFDQLVLDLVEKKPADRFQTPDELLGEIEKILKRYHKGNSLFRTTARTRAVSKRDIKTYSSKSNYLAPVLMGIAALIIAIVIIALFKNSGGQDTIKNPGENAAPSFQEAEFKKDKDKFIIMLNDRSVSLDAKNKRYNKIHNIYYKPLPKEVDALRNEMLTILDKIGYLMALQFADEAFDKSNKAINNKQHVKSYQFMINSSKKSINTSLKMLRKKSKNERRIHKGINKKRGSIISLLQKELLPIKSKLTLAVVKRLRDVVFLNKKDPLFLTQLNQSIKFHLTGVKPKQTKSNKDTPKINPNSTANARIKKMVGSLHAKLKNKNLVEFVKDINKNISEIRKNKDAMQAQYPEVDLAYKSIVNVYSKFRGNIRSTFMGDSIKLNDQDQTIIGVSEFKVILLNNKNVKTEISFDKLPPAIIMNYTTKIKDLDQKLKLHGGVYSILAGDKNSGDQLLNKVNKNEIKKFQHAINKLSN